ncbi:flagellar protein FliS [bacterium BMS3Bbin02]|nr:flagellar protein FliS [bacterium BMS3Bbin02]
MLATGTHSAAGNAYRVQAVESASPAQLVLMLYDGALGAIAASTRALTADQRDLATAHRELTRAQDIILELQLSLDHDRGGEIASSLEGIYGFCIDRLTQANVKKDMHPLADVTRFITELRDAWVVAMGSAT